MKLFILLVLVISLYLFCRLMPSTVRATVAYHAKRHLFPIIACVSGVLFLLLYALSGGSFRLF